MQFKTSFDEEYQTLVTRKEKDQVNAKKYVLTHAYQSIQGLSSAKLKDFQTLCEQNIIPPQHHEYYKSFQVKERSTPESDED